MAESRRVIVQHMRRREQHCEERNRASAGELIFGARRHASCPAQYPETMGGGAIA